ncbi:CheY-like chemotaxis protein [Bradyrhizobium japonicum]|nr:CheY-like chemotaxis protein [Bradyrhizobium japonicum]MCP1865656.1 CheY-like chemotaxis protein [Bradyrhizobium japonicum]MCP1895573.1 CheY-like chemotaxis protein [Bradyrhizobium japonicum]MCW2328956.1 CheY-like chemotaxis protein [Bradyrhizobium japonicum]
MSNFVTLLVEDNPPQREIMSDLLRDEGFEVVECATSACPPTAARKRTLSDFREGPKHKVAALQPAAREQEPRGR